MLLEIEFELFLISAEDAVCVCNVIEERIGPFTEKCGPHSNLLRSLGQSSLLRS